MASAKNKKSILITVFFLTTNLPKKLETGKVPYRKDGQVQLKSNPSKGIKSQKEFFKNPAGIPVAIESVLNKANLVAVDGAFYDKLARKKKKNQ